MLINPANIDLATKGFKTVYSDAYLKAEVAWDKLAMTVDSSSRDETYGWMGMMPQLREWLGSRVVQNLSAQKFTITNRKFESTVGVKREDFADDKLGLLKPVFANMGELARMHPEELVMGLLRDGFTTNCYDGQFFFDNDHIFEVNNIPTVQSNVQAGAGSPWFLLDTSRTVRPLIWQERETYEFQSVTDSNDDYVFNKDEYLYGVRARVNAGYGLWQLAFGSKATLDATNYAAARAAMMNFRSDTGRILGIKPNVLVVPPSLEAAALALVNTEYGSAGASNPWKGTADLIVTPFVL